MHFGKIADMLWISQVFENVNIVDMLEISQVLDLRKDFYSEINAQDCLLFILFPW
jgi:hypothetical protein